MKPLSISTKTRVCDKDSAVGVRKKNITEELAFAYISVYNQ